MTETQGTHQTVAIIDSVLALVVALMLAVGIGHHGSWVSSLTLRWPDALFLVVFIACWQYSFTVLHIQNRFDAISSRLFVISKGASSLALLLGGFMFLFHRSMLRPRMLVISFFVFICYETIRVGLFHWINDRLAARNPRRVLILGSGRRASKAWKEIRTRYHGTVSMLGFVDNRDLSEMAPDVASRLLGPIGGLDRLLVDKVVDTVLVALPVKSCYNEIQQAIVIAEAAGVEVLYLNDLFSSRRAARLNDSLFQALQPRPERHFAAIFTKRLIDLGGASIGLILLAPVFVVVALLVKVSSPGPILFVQQRHGYRRRLFPMLKFRSMVANAEAMMAELEAANEADGPVFKLAADPRVTRVGQFLRSTSLDELPQLFNVLIGQMSLVGPRPMSTRDVALMSEAMLMRRFSVRPGMTGLWQVSGRSSVGFDQWILLDGKYIDRWSLGLDLQILFRTVKVVFTRSGAV